MRVRLPESAIAPTTWAPLPPLRSTLTDEIGVSWVVEWLSADGNIARLRHEGIVRSVTRERVHTWTRSEA